MVMDVAKSEANSQVLTKPDLSLLHLQVALIQIDIRIMQMVRRWQQAQKSQGAESAHLVQPHYISDAEINALLKQPLGASWWHDTLPPHSSFAELQAAAAQRAQALSQTARQQGKMLRLEHLASAFRLSPFELDAFLVCLAPALDRRYERFYGYLQDDATRRWPSVNLILDLLCEPGPDRLLQLTRFTLDSPLLKFELLIPVQEPGVVEPPVLNQALRPDRTIVNWLLGQYQAKMMDHAVLVWPGEDNLETDRLLAKAAWQGLQRQVEDKPIFVFYGRDRYRQWATARYLAAQLDRPFLMFDFAAALKTDLLPLHILRVALRDARLTGAIPFLFGWDACLEDGAPPPKLFSELCHYGDLAIVAGAQKWQPRGIDRDHHLVWLEFSLPDYEQRQALLQHFIAQPSSVKTNIENSDIAAVASQFLFASGQIRDVVASARDLAIQRDAFMNSQDLFVSARAHSNPRLSQMARKIEPRYQWQDIILPPEQITMLRELVEMVRGRPRVLREWGVGKKLVSSNGITALFAGSPGTGKTMAAEVIAGELQLDLYKLDLSTVVSKYIGETEKNLEKVFTEAETSNAILFFDEADAIFGKRSEVRDSRDRYANMEISYLLQRMEAYDGITILATNLRANIDEAFTRRLHFVIDFPVPEEKERLRMWRSLLPASLPTQPDLDLVLMARRFKLSGGNIRNIIVSAAYLAAADGGRITMTHLLHGTRREFQKMGRMINEKDLELD
jgi:ATP-dependent 26S proteasome regulatory subunit